MNKRYLLGHIADKVSIVIPVYNAQEYVSECIESALNQTYQSIEIIAVDDGSTDDSLTILKRYSDKIRIITKENGGTASALNAGIKNMSGEWFKWLSADDVLYFNAIEELVKATKSLKDKRFILYSNYDIIDSKGNLIKTIIEPDYKELDSFNFNVILLDHYIGNGTTSLIHKSIIDEFGMFDEKIGYKEDYELWLRYCLMHNCRLYLVSMVLAKYRVHQHQLTKERLSISLAQTNAIRKYILSKLNSEDQKKYQIALQKYQKSKPLSVRGRHMARDVIFKVFPKSFSNKILKYYLKMKED